MAETAPQHFGRYQIRSQIGRGGMATVYLAHDPRFKRDVAIKILPQTFLDQPTFRARFEREAQMIAGLEHPAIVPVYDFGEQENTPFLVMRFMPGGSLADRLDKGALTLGAAADVIGRLADALDAVHQRGIIHRDLKPANILFDQYGNACISDFGIARLNQATVSLTGEAIIGTPAYMSPEQVRGDADLDGRSDIYALGTILFELLTGKQPFQATTPIGVALKQITEPAPRLLEHKAGLPAELDGLIQKAMAKERSQRFASAGELARALAAIAARQPTQSLPPAATVVEAPPPAAPPLPPTRIDPRPPAQPTARPVTAPPAAASQPASRPARRLPMAWLAGGIAVAMLICLAVSGVAGFAMLPGLGRLFSPAASPTTAASQPAAAPTPPADRPRLETALDAPQASDVQPTPAEGAAAPTALPVVTRFNDDFSNPATGWAIGDFDLYSVGYFYGNYRVTVEKPNTIAWGTPPVAFGDVSLEVDATKAAGPDDNMIGLICRQVDDRNYYLLFISSKGYFAISKYKDGEFTLLKMDNWGFSEIVHQGETTNRLRADCIGDTLSLYVNDSRLVSVEDTEFTSGGVGLAAAVFEIGYTEILFDNFSARAP